MTAIQNEALRFKVTEGIKETASNKLWSWDERFKAEINAVQNFFAQ